MDQSPPAPSDIQRRRLLQVAGLGIAAASIGQPALASASVQHVASVALDRDVVRIAAVQSHAVADISTNLASMLDAIDRIQTQASKKDLIVFHATALHGIAPRNLADARKMTIHLNDPIVTAIGFKAMQHRVYISFSAYTTDVAWPDAIIPRQFLIGPDGKIVLAAWQATHDETMPFLASVERVLDRYVEMYGRDAVLPVVRTNIGNIAFASAHGSPEIYRALALKDAEIVIRATYAAPARWDVQASAAYNSCFTIAAASAVALHAAHNEDASTFHGGGSVVVGPSGETLAEAGSQWEQTISANLPVAHARATRNTIQTHSAMILPIYARHLTLA